MPPRRLLRLLSDLKLGLPSYQHVPDPIGRHVFQQHLLPSTCFPGFDHDRGFRDLEGVGEEGAQRIIRRTFHRWGGNTNLQCLSLDTDDFCVTGLRLEMDREDGTFLAIADHGSWVSRE